MSGDIYLVAPGGRAGDIYLDVRNPSLSNYTITGRVVATNGTPQSGQTITVFERRSLVEDVVVAMTTTDARGGYRVDFSLPPSTGWDVFVRAANTHESVSSPLLSDLEPGTHTVDLVLGEGEYVGRTEWERVAAKVQPLLGATAVKDVPADRLEWLSKRADVSPLQLAAYVQAHRLALVDGRAVKPESCYAFLRAGLPSDLLGLLRAGETSWENALRRAWSRLILPIPGDGSAEDRSDEVATEVTAMRALLVDVAVATPVSGVNQRVVLDTAGLSEVQQRAFSTLWINHTGTLEEFWTAVSGSSLSAEVPLLQFTFRAATISGNHVGTIEALQAERTAGNITTIAGTTAWSVSDWDAVLVARSVTPPETVPGADATAKRQNYARALFNIIEDGHPSLSLRHSIARDEATTSAPPNTEFLVTFLTNNPDFDVVDSTVAVYLATATTPWAGIDPGDEAQARANLLATQRVYRTTPRIGRYATAKVLLDAGIKSASQIVSRTKREFVNEFEALFSDLDHHPDGLAEAIWLNATKINSTSIALASQFALSKSNADWVPVGFLQTPSLAELAEEEEENGLDNLAAILGNLDYCACEHCRSVFSPAAYLADLLKFLMDRGAALDTLTERRADIPHIWLDCANTNTVLPYIDLVNELLEAYILGNKTISASSKQTTWTADELRLHPEHVEPGVYQGPVPAINLTTLVHPWSLPFSLPTVEVQTYLRHLGVPRHELMRRYLHSVPEDTDLAMAADVLGLSDIEFKIVAGTFEGNESEDDREFWGFGTGDDDWFEILNGTATIVETNDKGDIGELLVRGRYSLDELREFLELDYIDPGGNVVFQWDESCELDDATIAFLEADELDRLHRFTRLQRACRIPARMLNVLLCDALGGVLDSGTLRHLANIVLLKERLRLEWDVLATFWASVIDPRDYTSGARSLYRRRFLAKDLGVDVNFDPAGDLTELFGEGGLITAAHLPRILAGVGIKQSDYELLVASDLATNAFSFANLTALFRSVNFARALKLSVAELARLAGPNGLIGENPFTSPASTLQFVDMVMGIHSSGFSVAELDWLLRHEFTDTDPLDIEETSRILIELARGLTTIEAETTQLAEQPEKDPEKLATHLAKVVATTGSILVDALKLVAQTTTMLAPEQNTFIDTHFAAFVDSTLAKSKLVSGPDLLLDVEARTGWLLGKVVGHLRRRALVHDTVSAKLAIPATVAEALLNSVLHDPAGGAPVIPRLFEVFRLPFATEEEITAGLTVTRPNLFDSWTRLAKAALICARFELRADEVKWYSGQFETWLDLDALPLNTGGDDASFLQWDALRQALELRDLSKPGEIAFEQIAEAADVDTAVEILAEHAGWDAEVMKSIAVTTLGYSLPSQIAGEKAPARLRQIVETAERLGVTINEALGWVSPTPTMAHAAAVKLAARAKYGEDRWPDIAAPLRDVIRERQRDALVDAAIAITPSFRTTNDVFEHLLIDVEMGHCMMTSRIKLAITSIQIFLHRAFLHLEGLTLDSEAIARWEWMKNYRVWEANRKVFLYPENWIEPELRLNKTPEFDALEANLMQGALDSARVEKALEIYLEKLDRVSSLEIMGVYDTHENGGGGDVWLLGRTHGAPHEWFVRRRSKRKVWSPWEEVPVQIEGDAVALVVKHDRLHLIWATTSDRRGFLSGAPVPAVVFQVTHVERSSNGEWTKPTLSPPSQTLVKFGKGLRTHIFLYHEEIRIILMTQWASSDDYVFGPVQGDEDVVEEGMNDLVFLVCAFSHRLVERQTHYLGWNFKGSVDVMQDKVFLSKEEKEKENQGLEGVKAFPVTYVKRSFIALQGDYLIHGQRHVSRPYQEGSGTAWNEEGEITDYPVVFLRKFGDGKPNPTLFSRPSSNGIPAFVYQANMWSPQSESRWLPTVYDDRKRKYLLEPTEVSSGSGDSGTVTPMKSFAADAFFICPEDVITAELTLTPAKKLAQWALDDVRLASSFPNGAPGSNGGGAHNVQFGEFMLNQAMETGTGNVTVDPDVDDNFVWKLGIESLYHPFSKMMIRALASRGVAGLYTPPSTDDLFRQDKEHDPFAEEDLYAKKGMLTSLPHEVFDFDYDTAYGIYNWELFYHVPMLIATKLAAEQRWDEAQRWYHFIFNPIEVVDEEASSKYWRIKPFVQQAAWLAKDQLKAMLGIGASDAEQTAATEAFNKQVSEWEDHPFDPHAIARIRPGVYQRALLRKYFDNLIAWADNLFRRDTIESISEATVLYIMLSQLLGPRPQQVPGPTIAPKSFADLLELSAEGELDAFANALVELESWIHLPPQMVEKKGCGPSAPDEPWVRVPIVSHFWYFCYPPNPQLLEYWNILEDRLFKIRHCQNIEGIERQLPLFEPPIDPALLVQATAAGVDLQSVLAELDSALPPYRFRSVHARAVGFTASLKGLGSALLSALEKQDAEELAVLRSQHELDMLARVRDIRVKQVAEARSSLSSLESAKTLAEDRHEHYSELLAEGLNDRGLNDREKQNFELSSKAHRMRKVVQGHNIVAGHVSLVPQFSLTGGIPPVSLEFGGIQLANSIRAHGEMFAFVAAGHDYEANNVSLWNTYQRRAEDWHLQRSQAEEEVVRVDKDIIGAKIRLQIAERELDNHDRQVAQAREVDMWMHSKFTNQQLYGWMVKELSTLYFQTYQLAFDLAKRAERAYRHELFITDGSAIIKYGYWDSLHKGLLAGEKLGHDLERLDLAYMDHDVREMELRKSVSLAELSPTALRLLQETGICNFDLPEVIFDLDHPGHYLRRIRGVRLTIPAVVGPYTSLGARLQLKDHRIRMNTSGGGYEEAVEPPDDRFRYGSGAGQAIATSTAIQDGGVFNLDFKDERYLPFEYAGAISSWSLTLPTEVRQFDYRTIEDVIVHVDYTARYGGDTFRGVAETAMVDEVNDLLTGQTLGQLVVVHEAFPNEWKQFFKVDGSSNHVLSLPVTEAHFPYFARRTGFAVTHVDLYLMLEASLEGLGTIAAALDIQSEPPTMNFMQDTHFMKATFTSVPAAGPDTWTLTVADAAVTALKTAGQLDPTLAVGMMMVVRYTLTPPP